MTPADFKSRPVDSSSQGPAISPNSLPEKEAAKTNKSKTDFSHTVSEKHDDPAAGIWEIRQSSASESSTSTIPADHEWKKGVLPKEESIKSDQVAQNRFGSSSSLVTGKKSPKISDKHVVKKTIPEKIKDTVVKVGVIAVSIIFGPLVLAAGLVTAGIFSLKNFVVEKLNEKSLTAASKKMKATEEQAKFEALTSAYKEMRAGAERVKFLDSITSTIQGDLLKPELAQNKLARFVLRAMARAGDEITPAIKKEILEKCNKLKADDFKSTKALEDALKQENIVAAQFFPQAQLSEILRDLRPSQLAKKYLANKNTDGFYRTLNKLTKALENPPKSHADANIKFIRLLRKALHNPVYHALKEDTSNQAVLFLHRMSAVIWNKTRSLDAYNDFGKTILHDVKFPFEDSRGEVDGTGTADVIAQSLHKANRQLLTNNTIPHYIQYALMHPLIMLDAMMSEKGALRTIAELYGRDHYDSHMMSNNPSLQGTTRASLVGPNGESIEATVNNCYGGSPTIGDGEIAPEFDAVCQAAENKMFATDRDLYADIPDVVYYTNFQNIENKTGEGPRSFTIMRQNELYPLTFKGITLAKDTEFHKMHAAHKKPESVTWTDSARYGDEMLKRLTEDACFELTGRMGSPKGNGFYFPGTKKEWMPVLTRIINDASNHFKDSNECSGNEAFELKAAYQEYVYSMIQAYLEMKVSYDHYLRTGNNPSVMAIRACKENIDRGGAENAKYAYTRMDLDKFTDKERLELIAGVLHSRSISVRQRVILDNRVEHIQAFMRHVDSRTFQENANKMLGEFFGIKSFDYQPALTSKKGG